MRSFPFVFSSSRLLSPFITFHASCMYHASCTTHHVATNTKKKTQKKTKHKKSNARRFCVADCADIATECRKLHCQQFKCDECNVQHWDFMLYYLPGRWRELHKVPLRILSKHRWGTFGLHCRSRKISNLPETKCITCPTGWVSDSTVKCRACPSGKFQSNFIISIACNLDFSSL